MRPRTFQVMPANQTGIKGPRQESMQMRVRNGTTRGAQESLLGEPGAGAFIESQPVA